MEARELSGEKEERICKQRGEKICTVQDATHVAKLLRAEGEMAGSTQLDQDAPASFTVQ